jgi:hypothetical protein
VGAPPLQAAEHGDGLGAQTITVGSESNLLFYFTLIKSVFFEQRMTRMESGRCSAATRIFATKPAASQRLVHPSSWPRCSCIIYSGNSSPRADGHFSATKAVHH